ncbi:hypothetical protein [Ramlibacter albus]|uniref:Uncharacterized protein n=1 Tax=Ramlibacter albus TaxID=2079448 RepID=A0A923S0N4_9BURK|nr:hypothetical protein [Ramlibacter albus]MBC5763549.1 hypothetical protein [Ramlibacter albus]
MHRISGPYRGYFVAAYTMEVRGGFVGYGEASESRPPNAWRAKGHGDYASSIYPSELQALVAAEHKVRLEIEMLPPSWAPFTVPGTLADSQ